MEQWIGGYRCHTPMRTAGSGSARWCVASHGLERFFLKEFLSPVYPVKENTPLGQKQRERCERFEDEKQRLYAAISCVIGETLVPVIDFFRFERKYYAVSELVPESHVSAEKLEGLTSEEKRKLLLDLALCLQRLHTQGVVHADLKPDHVLVLKRPEGYHARLIDLDSGFLRDEPPGHLEGDPAYLAPETFLRMAGESAELGTETDTFSFGLMIHQLWTGAFPKFDHERYHYLYEAALDGGDILLSPALPRPYHRTVRRMLSASPSDRPGDARIVAMFDEPARSVEAAPPQNSLRRFFHGDVGR